ncbi:Succinate-semialdehyde dehydrogenase [NADP(+)] GabD [Klebsiella quasipneumoniae subsp. similipneumoniae]|nr:Succinate-semialdehyde dehydrogenase [NADP(+)] GabD [Klebsiella quasipneumoniae subsp. similipneumoniae]
MSVFHSDLFRQQALIAGSWRDAADGTTLAVSNPSTGATLGQIPNMGRAEAQQAVDAAAAALPAWRALTAAQRAALLKNWHRLILENKTALAQIMTAEQGKPLAEAEGEIAYAASFIEWFAEQGKRANGEIIPSPGADKRLMVIRQGVGVCAAITPWNSPIASEMQKVAPAIAAGNAVILKPAEATPLMALELAKIFEQAGLPAGLLSVLPGKGSIIGDALARHPKVRKISFTGGTTTGRHLAHVAAEKLIPASLELGGKSPTIVLEDADIEQAAAGAIFGAFANAGQICMSTERIIVDNAVAERFIPLLARRAASLPASLTGPVVDMNTVTRCNALIDDALAKGARLLTGGKASDTHMAPTLLDGVTREMRLWNEESFGPVKAIIRVNNDEEALAVANDSEYGLSAAVYSRDSARAWNLAQRLQTGICHINGPTVHDEAQMPFGGCKASGYGRFGGRAGIAEFTELRWITLQTQPRELPF